jgi:hypothetical protein
MFAERIAQKTIDKLGEADTPSINYLERCSCAIPATPVLYLGIAYAIGQ